MPGDKLAICRNVLYVLKAGLFKTESIPAKGELADAGANEVDNPPAPDRAEGNVDNPVAPVPAREEGNAEPTAGSMVDKPVVAAGRAVARPVVNAEVTGAVVAAVAAAVSPAAAKAAQSPPMVIALPCQALCLYPPTPGT